MKKFITLFLLIFLINKPVSYSPSCLYPNSFLGEPRLVKDWLSTIDVEVRGGYGKEGHNGCSQEVNILDIYGCENFYDIAKGVPEPILDCNPGGYLNDLWEKTPRATNFGKVCMKGKFNLSEFELTLTQNLIHGIFLSLTIPIDRYSVSEVTTCDQTTAKSAPTPSEYFDWQSFINNYQYNLSLYGICIGNSKSKGLGDIQLLTGWTHSFENFRHLDFFDIMLSAGINFPTAPQPPATFPYCACLGYNGHYGIPIVLSASIGIFDWLTLGISNGILWFKDKKRSVTLKTAYEQSGVIRLGRDDAMVHQGTMWGIYPFIKADHLIGGFSLTLSFSRDHQNQTFVTPCNSNEYNKAIANSDERFFPWDMNSFHLILDFDFASFKHSWAPRIGFTIDKSMNGKRIFDSAIFGAAITCDIEW